VEDLALSFEDFESLCVDGVLRPHARNLTVKPHVRLWCVASPPGRSRASGHVELEGFLPNSVLRLSGFKVGSEKPLSEEEEKQKVLDLIELSLLAFLRKTFPECQLTVSPATAMRQG
jgi:hypothetical protein